MDFFELMPYFLLVISVVFIGMSLFVFLRKKPLILNFFWMLLILFLCFFPQILSSIQMFLKYPSFIGILPAFMFGVFIIWLLFMMKGYRIYGVDGADFQKSLIEYLNDNHYEFEQNLSTLKIKNPEIELSISIQSWIGIAQLRFKGKENHEVLKSLINDLKKKDIKANYIFPVFFAITGVLISILAISMILK